MKKTEKKIQGTHHKILNFSLKDLILAEIIGALISGVIGGVVHLLYDQFHLESKVENVCDILKQKDQASCKKVIDSIMDAAEENIDNYNVEVK